MREGGELIATPTLVDLTGDGRPEIVIGAQEEYEETPNIGDGASMLALLGGIGDLGNSRLYAISPDGRNATNPDRSAGASRRPGVPAGLAGRARATRARGAADDRRRHHDAGGRGRRAPASRDRDRRGRPPRDRRTCSTRPATPCTARSAASALPAAWAGGLAGEGAARFGAQRNTQRHRAEHPGVLRLRARPARRRRRSPEFAAPTMGFTRLLDIQASDLQLPNDDQLSGWQGSTGNLLPGFPQVTSDMAFFVTPAIADLDGDGTNEVDRRQRPVHARRPRPHGRPARGLAQAHRRLARRHARRSATGTATATPSSPSSGATASSSCGTPRPRPRRSPSGRAAAATPATPASTTADRAGRTHVR